MRYRCSLSSVCVVLVACGGSDPAEREPGSEATAAITEATTEATQSPASPRADSPNALQLTLEGEPSLLNGGARLEVR
ncbi:MAG: hypothetical protein RL033_1580, partial [Pseudomonadota bacterium]